MHNGVVDHPRLFGPNWLGLTTWGGDVFCFFVGCDSRLSDGPQNNLSAFWIGPSSKRALGLVGLSCPQESVAWGQEEASGTSHSHQKHFCLPPPRGPQGTPNTHCGTSTPAGPRRSPASSLPSQVPPNATLQCLILR